MKFYLVILALVLGASGAVAHHSYGMFDMNREQVLSGTVVNFEWTNPHAWLHVETQVGGVPQTWSLEMPSPGILSRIGWKRSSLRPGDKVEVVLHPLRDNSLGGSFVSAKTADGKPVVPVPVVNKPDARKRGN